MSDLFVVRRRRCWWERPDEMEEPYAVTVFRSLADAEADARQRSQRHLQWKLPRHNPFVIDWPDRESAVRELASVTSFPGYALRDWLLDAGFPDWGLHAIPDGDAEFDDWYHWGMGALEGESEVDPKTGRSRGASVPYRVYDDQVSLLWMAMNLYPVFEAVGVDWHPAATAERP